MREGGDAVQVADAAAGLHVKDDGVFIVGRGKAFHGQPGCYGDWKQQSSPSSSVTGSSARATFTSDTDSGCEPEKEFRGKVCKVTAVCEFV